MLNKHVTDTIYMSTKTSEFSRINVIDREKNKSIIVIFTWTGVVRQISTVCCPPDKPNEKVFTYEIE